MKKALMLLLFLSLATMAQKVAIINTMDDGTPPVAALDLSHLTDRLREIARKTLPQRSYDVMSQQTIQGLYTSNDEMIKACSVAEGCLVKIGREISAEYICQGRIGRFEKDYTIKVELYESLSGNLVDSFTGQSKNISGLLAILNEKAPDMFRRMPRVSGGGTPSFADGISVQGVGDDYVPVFEKLHLVNVSTEPSGAMLSFNGDPISGCAQSPCKAQVAEGQVSIVAVLDQYERTDTTVFIRQSNQSINIKLKSNFGVLDIKPAYSEGVGRNENWSLSVNGKPASLGENRLSPGKYNVRLSHRCYEDIGFDVGLNKGSREVFDMSQHIKLKRGALVLSAEKNGQPASEPVFVAGKQVGETPYSGSVAICSDIAIGKEKERVAVKLENRQTVRHTHKIVGGGMVTDARDGKKDKVVKIGSQTWMAENLNYNASDSKCYDNKPDNCAKYGRLYNWQTAKTACPKGWHLPNNDEWQKIVDFAGGDNFAGKKLKAVSGWYSNGSGTDNYGFSALPGGYGRSGGNFYGAGFDGDWWSSSENERDSDYAQYRFMRYNYEYASRSNGSKTSLFSVRCVQD